jgi:hypothetical protein
MSQRAPRKCSQCRQEGCNKSKAICPVNIARGYMPRQLLPTAGTCELCRRGGCNTLNPECPVKILVDHHTLIASGIQDTRYIYRMDPINVNPNLFDHIENPILKEKYLKDLNFKLLQLYIRNNRNLYDAIVQQTILAPPIPKKTLVIEVSREFKMTTEECGICYDKPCKVTFNCNHQSCVGCFKGHYAATKSKNSPLLKCPFCRGTIDSVYPGDKNTRDLLVGRNKV